MTTKGNYAFPAFYSFPPYFTLQPVQDTQEKQLALWRDFVLDFCRHHEVFVVDTTTPTPLFANEQINRRLDQQGRAAVLQSLVAHGRAEWTDDSRRACWVLWKTVDDWGRQVLEQMNFLAAESAVVTPHELSTECADLRGVPQQFIMRIVRHLESKGKVRTFGGGETDLGIKVVDPQY